MLPLEERQEPICSTFFKKIFYKVNYFGDNSVLHGVGHVFSMSYIPMFKRLFWLTMLVLSSVGAALMLRAASGHGGAVSFSVETNFLDFNTPFPAVYVCESIVRDNDRIRAFMIKNGISIRDYFDFYKDNVYWNDEYCKSCKKCKINETCIEDILGLVAKYKFNCTELMGDCWWNDKPFKCCERFHPIMTEYGTCFVFNSRLIGNDSGLFVRHASLPHLVVSTLKWATVRVSSPDDVLAVSSENVVGKDSDKVPLIFDYEFLLSAVQTVADKSVVTLPPSVRRCLMPHEHPDFAYDWPFTKYSYGACLWYCRAEAQRDLCNCTHHFMTKMERVPICDLEGLKCLAENAKKIIKSTACVCPSECEEITYKLIHAYGKRQSGKITPELAARGSRGVVRFLQAPSMRVKRQVIRDMMSFVVDIGGVGGVFFGASVLGVIEIVYLFCIRR